MNGYACYLDTGCYVEADNEDEARWKAVQAFRELLMADAIGGAGEETVEILIERDVEGDLKA